MAKSNHTKPCKKGGALKILLVVLVLLVLAAGAALLLAKREIDGGTEQEEAVTVEIAQGSGVSTIAKKLQEAGVIRFPQLFRWYVGREGAAAKLQYGEFSLEPGSSYDAIIAALSEYAKAESVRLTFPEGITAIDIAQRMEAAGLCTAKEFLEEANTGKGLKLGRFLKPYFQFILPVLILIILIQGLL